MLLNEPTFHYSIRNGPQSFQDGDIVVIHVPVSEETTLDRPFLSMTLSVVIFPEKCYSSWMTVSDGFGLFLVSRPSSSQRCPIGDNLKTILATATLECDYSPKLIKMCLQRAFSVKNVV